MQTLPPWYLYRGVCYSFLAVHTFNGNLLAIRGMYVATCAGIYHFAGFPAQIVWEAELNGAISKAELTK